MTRAALSTSITSIIAQQTAMIAMLAAATTVSSAST